MVNMSSTQHNNHVDPTGLKQPYRIGWILTGGLSLASSRLQGHRIHDHLIATGYDSHIVTENFGAYEKNYSRMFFATARRILRMRCNIVFFQKPGWMMFKMSEMLRLRGVKTIAIQCDPFPGDYGHYFDATIVTSEELKHQLGIPSAHVIDDMLEVPATVYKHDYAAPSDRLRVAWVGQGTGPAGKQFIQPFIQQLAQHPLLVGRTDFITISRGEWATHQWSLETVYDQLCECDVAVIPFPEDNWVNAKSTNRLTMLMALGLPTVISPIPSYQRIARPDENCISARSVDEFAAAIERCRDETLRARLGTAGRALALAHYAPTIIGPAWLEVIHHTLRTTDNWPASNLRTRLISTVVGLTTLL